VHSVVDAPSLAAAREEGSSVNKIRRSRARGVRTRVVAAVMLLGLLAVAGGAARPVSAQPASSITIIPAQNPPTSATLSS